MWDKSIDDWKTPAEYIDREAAIKAMEKADCTLIASDADDCKADYLREIIESVPAADVAPVVMCKDCIHYDLGVCLKIYSDGNAQKDSWQSRKPNDFCSRGERRDGGESNV